MDSKRSRTDLIWRKILFHYLLTMQRLWTCLLLAVTVRGTLVADGNGDPSPGLQLRVVGGQIITNAELGGYIVAMFYLKRFVCGGTLIQDRIVLSAAHCFLDREKKDEWDFIGGISNLNEMGERRKMKDLIISPNFRRKDLHSDVAVIFLKEPLVGKNISKVSLCNTKLKEGMSLNVSGWGVTKDGGKIDNYLRYAAVPFIEWNTCREKYTGKNTNVNITNAMLCAGVFGSKDACLYDSGGPLVYNKEICGIVSFGIGCAHIKYPGVYADVLFEKSFIEQSIQRLLSD